MWRTPDGIRVVTGAESVLLRATIVRMIEDLVSEQEHDCNGALQTIYEVSVFDDLPLMQRVGLLHQVAEALLREDVPPPPLTAIREGTLAAILNNVEQLIRMEIDAERDGDVDPSDASPGWRAMLVACTADHETEAAEAGDEFKPIDVESDDPDDWSLEVECFRDRFLWDVDYEYTDIPDLPPEEAGLERERLGIVESYYTALPPDPPDAEFDELIRRLRRLCETGGD